MLTLRLILDSGAFTLIWLVQGVIYPAFLHADAGTFCNWHRRYTGRVTWIVAPIMFGQLGVAAWQLAVDVSSTHLLYAALIAVTWITTFTLSVPCHRRMTRGKDKAVIRRLIATNWPRTIAWSAIFALTAWETIR